jgi:hypothetical protein
LSALAGAVAPELIEIVKTTSATLPAIRAVWILDVIIGSGEPQLAIIVELAPGSVPSQLAPALMIQVQTRLAKGEYVDCLPLLPGMPLLETARKLASPVFAWS